MLSGQHGLCTSPYARDICVGREESLRRKDAIIRVRNAQISGLWDELHTKQPWRNALDRDSMMNLPSDTNNASRALVVFGINTVSFIFQYHLFPPVPSKRVSIHNKYHSEGIQWFLLKLVKRQSYEVCEKVEKRNEEGREEKGEGDGLSLTEITDSCISGSGMVYST